MRKSHENGPHTTSKAMLPLSDDQPVSPCFTVKDICGFRSACSATSESITEVTDDNMVLFDSDREKLDLDIS